MNKLFTKLTQFFCFVFLITVLFGCSPRTSKSVYSWEPKVELLEKSELKNPQLAGITKDVKTFYEDLHKHLWDKAYMYRNRSFRNLIPIDTYLTDSRSRPWELVDYEILGVRISGSNKVILNCRFIEGPNEMTSYNTVTWTKEGEGWHCDAAGPTGLGLPDFSKMVY